MSKRGESRCQGNCQGKVVKAYVWTALGSDGLVLILNKEHVQNERELRIRRFESYLRSQFELIDCQRGLVAGRRCK